MCVCVCFISDMEECGMWCTFSNGVRHGNYAVHGWLSVEAANEVGQIVQDGEIVFDGDNIAIWTNERSNDFCSLESLPDIEVT